MKQAEHWRPVEGWRSAHSAKQRSDPIQPKNRMLLRSSRIHSLIMELTRLLHRDIICSRDVTIPFAMALESSGSNFAASSSFAMALPIATPSAIPGALRAPPENTWPTASLTRLEHRVRNEISNTESDRRTKIVSGLWILSAESRGERSQLPLMGLSVDCVRMNRDLREELVDQAQQPWIVGTQGRLQKRGSCTFV